MRILLSGQVQGVGVRPAIARLAEQMGVCGTVANQSGGVEVVVEGSVERIDRFRGQLAIALPAAAVVEDRMETPVAAARRYGFRMERQLTGGPLAVRVPADRVVCAECLGEVGSRNDRRCGYPFTSCALCGPRYSIVSSMPYERDQTAMSVFPLCADCRGEETDSADRRFHAQTTACPACGPRIWFENTNGDRVDDRIGALAAAVEALRRGEILALRGLGGYQLLADATCSSSVERLRRRKQRQGKPLAVLTESLATAERIADFDQTERRRLADPSGPIVLVRSRPNAGLADGIAPGLDTVGLMLPTTPLHWQLAREFGKPLVCTSGNREGEPLVFNEGGRRLAGIADGWLDHDRLIVRPIDDSVVRVIADRMVTIRSARGLAPLPLRLPSTRPMLAVGGHQKAAVALSNGMQAVLGPHVGDLDTLATRQRFVAQIEQLTRLYDFQPELLIHDLHPDYFSTRWAAEQPIPSMAVQHHHAHIAAGMLEHDWLDREVLGVAFDGTGYGPDGTVWGGEFLVARAESFRRIGHLRPFRLPGAAAAVREPWRVAVALIRESVDAETAARLFPRRDVLRLLRIADRTRLSPRTTSAGRLFDAVAAIVLGIEQADFEGQPAMLLEAACDPKADGEYALPLDPGSLLELDWRLLIGQLLADHHAAVPPGVMAMRFHRGLAAAIAAVCKHYLALPVVLSGGCFQNRMLTELVGDFLDGHPQPIGVPGSIPPNDGGLAVGQLAVAAARLRCEQQGTEGT